MNTLKRAFMSSILTLALSILASAGEIETTVAPQPPIPQVTKQGEIETTRTGEAPITTKFALDVILSLLSLT
jgi:hypothetical protein